MPGAWKTVIKGSAGLLLLAAAMLLVVAGRDVDGLWRSVAELSPIRLAVLCLLLSAGALLAGLRLRIIASDLGFRLSIRDSIAALSVGQIAGAIAFQLLGQLIGRSALLARRKVPFAGTALMMGYERAAALCASLLIAIAGAVYLFGDIQVTLGLEAADLVKIGIGVVAATAAGAWLVWGREAADLIRQIRLWHVLRFFRTFLLSLLVQSTTMAAYVLCAEIIAPSMSIMNIAAASALVMFAASIPISFAGFGLREMSAVLALQQIGMTPGEALAVALEIGTLSLLVVGALAVITANPVAQNSPPIELAHPTAKESFDYSNVLGWALAVASATLVFFQVFLPTNSGQINVNLADPI
ncbi:MAG TPA: lysylphosphatidylglycerol synthase domain-containing protein, partial [Xanthobacteraceae bacterium]|nr:lysylphosphatidylglycerol synthase domain-containing protein [Xanthobacteraceae bacterium]